MGLSPTSRRVSDTGDPEGKSLKRFCEAEPRRPVFPTGAFGFIAELVDQAAFAAVRAASRMPAVSTDEPGFCPVMSRPSFTA